MFLLQDLPNEEAFKRFSKMYPDLDPASVAAFLHLLKAGSNLLCWLDEFLADYGISHGRWITLILLKRDTDVTTGVPMTPSVLAAKQGVSKPTMSKLLRGLVNDGLVKIDLSQDDYRGKIVRLTKKGQRKLDSIMPHYYREISKKFSVFEEARLRELASFLNNISRVFQTPNGQR